MSETKIDKSKDMKKSMKKIVIGIVAHVDSGKTTLSESMLYLSGRLRKLGRVDNKDAFLDTYQLEKERGITIFSKQALLEIGNMQMTLLDTPGHVDFSAEMERTLQVLDYAILVISGADGIQGHTLTLWRLLKQYHIPTFLFVNKMDQKAADRQVVLNLLKERLSEGCIPFDVMQDDSFYEQIACCDEEMMAAYFETGAVDEAQIMQGIRQRKIFPCFFGSALKLEGVEALMQGLEHYTVAPSYPAEFGAKIFKIGRDEQGNRLTYMKITGGSLKVRETLASHSTKIAVEMQNESDYWEEKVNQIRLYSGAKFEAVNSIDAGSICAVTGLTKTYPGQGLGIEGKSIEAVLEPVLGYQILLPEDCDPRLFLPKLKQIEEEEPQLRIVWQERLQEIHVQIMGEVQLEILQELIMERFGISISFGQGTILYKETIKDQVEGVGHFEPLRHYAEVHVVLTPGERESGIQYETNCSEDVLDKNWQRLILTHLKEKQHRGVLTGSPVTDVKITLVAGRAHKKHTEGGDFREATYRAVRQGLMQAESILLEPYYAFELELPSQMVGRAMTDIEKMKGTCEVTKTEGDFSVLSGNAPVYTMQNYQREVIAYTKGLGKLYCRLMGYAPCHNTEEILEKWAYDPERDIENTPDSVFCSHGAGFAVPWAEVKDYMHVEAYLKPNESANDLVLTQDHLLQQEEKWIDLEEIDQILQKTYYANQGEKSAWKVRRTARKDYYEQAASHRRTQVSKQKYLLVDGYNIIFAWPELKALANENMDGAKIKLLEALCNYQGIKKCEIIVVFDAYRVKGHQTEVSDYHNIHVVYTKEAETADRYIERFAHTHQEVYDVTVATSDGLEQVIIRGKGCHLLSARELREELNHTHEQVMRAYQEKQVTQRHCLKDALDETVSSQLEALIKQADEK